MSQLPNEILLSILKYCDYETIMAMSYANKNLNNFVHGNWRHFPKKHLDLVVIALTNADEVDIEYEGCVTINQHRYRKIGGDKWQVIIAQGDSDQLADSGDALLTLLSNKNAKVTVEDPIKILREVISTIQERCTIHELQLCEMTPKSLSAIADTLTKLKAYLLHVALALPENDDVFCSAIDETARIVEASDPTYLEMTCDYVQPHDVPFNRFVEYFVNTPWRFANFWVPAHHHNSIGFRGQLCKQCSRKDSDIAFARFLKTNQQPSMQIYARTPLEPGLKLSEGWYKMFGPLASSLPDNIEDLSDLDDFDAFDDSE